MFTKFLRIVESRIFYFGCKFYSVPNTKIKYFSISIFSSFIRKYYI